MSRTYQAKYKCRLCGEVFADAITGSEDIVYKSMFKFCFGLDHDRSSVQTPMSPVGHTVHFCKDGGLGVTDFMGFECKDD